MANTAKKGLGKGPKAAPKKKTTTKKAAKAE